MSLESFLAERSWGLFRFCVMALPLVICLGFTKLQLVFICARARRTLRRYS